MSTQDKDKEDQENGMLRVINILSDKDYAYWDTITRRNTFRSLRHTLARFDMHLYIPLNHVKFSSEYCEKFGDTSCEQLKVAPPGWIPSCKDRF